jgi:hypothetical protein
MAPNFDISKLTQAAAMKATPHDNCIVLDLGTGAFPRDIEVRLPDDDGARQNALWDGSLNLDVNDEVLCFEYSGISAWRIMGMGGNDGGAGKVRVSEVWESDFGAVALETDTSGNVTINGTRTLTIPTDLIHAGDPDTKWSFTDDEIKATVGGLSMLKLTEAGQDTLDLGDVAGGGDVDISLNSGQMFLQGSDGFVSFGPDITPEANFHLIRDGGGNGFFWDKYGGAPDIIARRANGSLASPTSPNLNNQLFGFGVRPYFDDTVVFSAASIGNFAFNAEENIDSTHKGTRFTIGTTENGNNSLSERMRINNAGDMGIGVTTILAQLHVDQKSTTAAQPVLLLDQADISEEMIKFVTTIGVGNAIEAVGGKTLTPTHFIKVTLPGGLTRYFEVGTIA